MTKHFDQDNSPRILAEPNGPSETAHTDQGFVFRDIEVSRLQHVSEHIRLNPAKMTAIYFAVSLIWTLCISYGAALHGTPNMALDMAPFAANFVVTFGIVAYPARQRWIPVLAGALLFTIPLYMPFTPQPAWGYLPEVTMGVIGYFYLLNLACAALPAFGILWMLRQTQDHIRPYEQDMLVIAAIFGASLLCGLVNLQGLYILETTLTAAQHSVIGMNSNLVEIVPQRGFRGAIVSALFMLALLQTQKSKELKYALPFVLLYPGLAMLHDYGLGGQLVMDAALMSCILALILPANAAPVVIILGLSSFIVMSGAFVMDESIQPADGGSMEFYTILSMIMIAMILALRGRGLHEREQRMASIRRLSTVRGFAGVGLFTLNVSKDDMRLDPAGQRLLDLPQEANLKDLVDRFRTDEQYLLRHAIESKSHASITLLLQLEDTLDTGDNRVLRLHLWAETTTRDERVVYGLMVEVTEEHLQERALTDALNELSLRQDKQKQLFSIVSHEIRTPASVISMLIDELETGLDAPEVRNQMREASSQLLSVLDDMRQAVNPEKNQPLTIKPYVPSDVAERVRNTYQMQAKGKNIAITLELGPDANTALMGDSTRLKQILGNLVRNAIIHSEGTQIKISYQPDRSNALTLAGRRNCWRVTDDGVGIPFFEVERLFQPFERGNDDARNKADGSGLGLFIAKQSIELLGGDVQYFDAPEGGAGYKLWLPDDPATQEDMQVGTGNKPQAPKQLGELRVLLAEDNELVAQVTSKQLSRVFGKIELAVNGREALDKLRQDPPDLLITDLFMPEMAGDELISAMKAEGHNIPAIGLTAAVVGDDIKRFEDVGATAVLPKPLDVKKLYRMLEDMVAA